MHSNLQHKSPVIDRGQPIGKAPGEAATLQIVASKSTEEGGQSSKYLLILYSQLASSLETVEGSIVFDKDSKMKNLSYFLEHYQHPESLFSLPPIKHSCENKNQMSKFVFIKNNGNSLILALLEN
ncbi:hypothetical protein CFP56_018572 [Quercus suber]|uniref:Uncharacterized protein n=1 Tax=Quercus suber TaxID=58331 RepID=A0AAW0M1Y2_QUESU